MAEKEKIEISPEVAQEEGKTVVYLPVCRRIAGEVVCEEKGIRVIYGGGGQKPILERMETKYPAGKSESGGGRIRVTSYYERGIVGPTKVIVEMEEESKSEHETSEHTAE